MHRFFLALLGAAACLATVLVPAPGQETPHTLRAGIIGLDTSHVVAFTGLLTDPKAPPEVAGVRIVAACPGGSPDIPASKNRVEGYTRTLRDKYHVEIVDSIEKLLARVDVVLLESVDGRPHLQQVIPVLKAGKPVFIDKPIAGSLADTLRIFALARKYKTPVFSSSSLRFSPGILGMRHDAKAGQVLGCAAYGPCELEPHHPDLVWYGIHGVEMLYTIMGTGCKSVTRVHSKDYDLVVGTWHDGRIGTFRGIRKGAADYGATVFGSKKIVPAGKYAGYQPLVVEIVKFFKTGRPPVSADETTEIFAFMEAADESKRRGGTPVRLEDVLVRAMADAARK